MAGDTGEPYSRSRRPEVRLRSVASVTAGGSPSLSVVIPTTRGGADLDACIDSLVAERYPALEVIVVDNGSSASLEHLAERLPGLSVLRNEENLGFVGACNQGLAASGGELVLFLNDDTVVEPGALAAFVGTLGERSVVGRVSAEAPAHGRPEPSRHGGLVPHGDRLPRPSRRVRPGGGIHAHGRGVRGEGRGPARAATRARPGRRLRPGLLRLLRGDRPLLATVARRLGGRLRRRMRGSATASAGPRRRSRDEFVQFHSFKNRICSLAKNLGPARLAWMLPLHLVPLPRPRRLVRAPGPLRASRAASCARSSGTRDICRRPSRKRAAVQRGRRRHRPRAYAADLADARRFAPCSATRDRGRATRIRTRGRLRSAPPGAAASRSPASPCGAESTIASSSEVAAGSVFTSTNERPRGICDERRHGRPAVERERELVRRVRQTQGLLAAGRGREEREPDDARVPGGELDRPHARG